MPVSAKRADGNARRPRKDSAETPRTKPRPRKPSAEARRLSSEPKRSERPKARLRKKARRNAGRFKKLPAQTKGPANHFVRKCPATPFLLKKYN